MKIFELIQTILKHLSRIFPAFVRRRAPAEREPATPAQLRCLAAFGIGPNTQSDDDAKDAWFSVETEDYDEGFVAEWLAERQGDWVLPDETGVSILGDLEEGPWDPRDHD